MYSHFIFRCKGFQTVWIYFYNVNNDWLWFFFLFVFSFSFSIASVPVHIIFHYRRLQSSHLEKIKMISPPASSIKSVSVNAPVLTIWCMCVVNKIFGGRELNQSGCTAVNLNPNPLCYLAFLVQGLMLLR